MAVCFVLGLVLLCRTLADGCSITAVLAGKNRRDHEGWAEVPLGGHQCEYTRCIVALNPSAVGVRHRGMTITWWEDPKVRGVAELNEGELLAEGGGLLRMCFFAVDCGWN